MFTALSHVALGVGLFLLVRSTCKVWSFKMTQRKLNAAERAFVAIFAATDRASESYRQSHDVANLTEPQINSRASKLKQRADVQRAVEAARKKYEKDFLFEAADVMREWLDIATADPNELTSYQRRCCRHCHGLNHGYQWTSANEYAAACARVIDANRDRKPAKQEPLPDFSGGVGFDFTKRPHPECLECRGEGVGAMFVHDTTKLSPKARKLYAGIKQTPGGIQVLMRDQDAALNSYARALGLFVEKMELTGRDGGPIAATNVPLPTDPLEAAKIYQQLIKGSK